MVSASIPAFNSARTLARVIAALRAQLPEGSPPVLVVDSGSADASAKAAETAGARVVRLERNLGRGAARARILAESATPLVLMCDATLEIADDFLARALPWFEEPQVAAVFGRVVQPPSASAANRWRGRHLFRQTATANLAPARRALLATGLCVLRAESVRAAGGFDPAYFAHEDAELGARLLAQGFDVVADPALQARPLASDSIPTVLERYVRWNTQSRMSWKEYARNIAFSARVMARQDLQAGDPVAALISLAAPHCQFWGSRRLRREVVRR